MKSILSSDSIKLKNIFKMKKKHIFSVNVIRDKMNLKPPYNKLNDFLKTRDKDSGLTKADLLSLRKVVSDNTELLLSDIDTLLTKSKTS